MRDSLRRTWAPVAAATLLILTPSSGLWAGGGAGDAKAVDRAIHASLKDVINQGASLYNRGDRYGCYRVYDGALRAVRPLLSSHADLQKLIDEALAGVEQLPSPGHRAFALRDVLDAVRGKLGGTDQKTTLWDRLGGEDNVRKVVHEFVVTAGADPKVNITRDGKFKLDDKKVALLEQRVVEYVSSISGGPLRYTGKSMKEVHKGMAITNAEFDVTAGHFIKALQKYGAKKADIDALVNIVAATRPDIVEVPDKKGTTKDKKEEKLPSGTGKVVGKITFSDGPPAPSGYLTLISVERTKFSTYISPDGSYAFKTPVPQGNYIVTIEPALKDDPLAVKNVPIPGYYRDGQTSPIRVDVIPGRNTLELRLGEPSKK